METRCLSFSSASYQEPDIDQACSPSPRKNANSNEVELNQSNSFFNNNQSYIRNDGLAFQNCSVPFLDIGIDSNFTRHDNLNHQFSKQQNTSQFTQMAQNTQNTDQILSSSMQNNIQMDYSLVPVIRNSYPYDQITYLDEAQENNSTNLSQIQFNPLRSNSSISSSAHLKPDSGANSLGHQSLVFSQPRFNSAPNISRNTSLRAVDSVLLGEDSFEWNATQFQFQSHRRTPSEYSDVSAPSVQHSPNLAHQKIFEHQNSPMNNAQDSGIFQDVLDISNISLSDPQIPNVQNSRSPSWSPAISPRLVPKRVKKEISLLDSSKKIFHDDQQLYSQEPFPPLQNESGQAQQIIPPKINVELAPLSRQNTFEPSKSSPFDQNALIPIDKGRRRAFTDTASANSNIISRPRNSLSFSPGYSSDLSFHSPNSHFSLSPHSRPGLNSPNRIRRRSTPAIPNRNHTSELCDSIYQVVSLDTINLKRAQKHPATYQCHLCPKKFTRAYNLRSHLRTHTNEKPFLCSKCNKAFARQHDRKRHEGLHSGEKRFICKGELKLGGQWGCGRRFARADALNRHFRSEAGRICINPLLEEDESEKQCLWNETQIQSIRQSQPQINMSNDLNGVSNQFPLPAALLAQYPDLAIHCWSELPQGDGCIEDNLSGRNSFDASGSEYYE